MRLLLLSLLCPLLASAATPLDLGTRWELFVDEHLVAKKDGLALKLQTPVRREIVLTTDKPWEGPTCGYFSAIQDGKKVRLYYRGSAGGSDHSDAQVTCFVESEDGIHFTRPKLGLIEAGGTKDNNVIWRGVESHNFAPFLDANPNAKPSERYKALGGVKQPGKNWHQGETPGGLYAFASPDGIHWKKMQDTPVITKGAFDSQNLAFWDVTRNRYASFSRIFSNKVRAIQSMTSTDFLSWGDGVAHQYAKDVPFEHFYTSATVPCPTAPHLFLSFPKRFATTREKVKGHIGGKGVSDAVFMSSRDGTHWDRPFLEAWVRPGPDLQNWTERSNMTACGIYDPGDGEWSLYISEHYRHPDHRIRRLTVRKQGFASMHADAKGGSFTTKPIKVTGSKLLLNSATSATGSLLIEAINETGAVAAKSAEIYGDEFEANVLDTSKLIDKAVTLHVTMKDADLYAWRFAD
ncbi:MAG: hypothetical protein RIS79_1970 [Verrucomicrobiota bacterium]|jgi:hypothetical protein